MRIAHSLWRKPGARANRARHPWLLHFETQTPHSFKPSGRVAICCLSGELWVTQENDPADYFVPRGHCFGTEKAGVLVVGSASAPSTALIYGKGPAPTEALSGCGVFPDEHCNSRVIAVANTLRLRAMKAVALRFARKLRRLLIPTAR